MDRYVMNLLLNDVKRDFGLSEMQAGLLAGAGFAVFYALMTLPMGLIADRTNRTKLAAAGVAVWSLMTIYCGRAKSFTALMLGRTGVGIGEATLTPAAYPLIKSIFKKERLSTAIAIYSCGIYIGSGLAYWLGGKLLAAIRLGDFAELRQLVMFDWQLVFVLFGLPGLLVALLLYFSKTDNREDAPAANYGLAEVKQLLFNNKGYFLKFSLASALFNVGVYAAGVWLPAYLQRTHGLSVADSGKLLGMAMLFVAPVGALTGGLLGDKLSAQGSNGRLKAIMLTVIAVLFSFLLLLPNYSGGLFYLPLLALCFTLGMPVAITAAEVQERVDPAMRSFAPAVLLTLQNLIGMSIGPAAVALLTQYVFGNESDVGYSVGIVGVTFTLAALVFFNHLKNRQHV
jgi:predicted MFS family arabinose efflux permease